MKKFMTEFKEFISRGNVMDMAVGVIIGGAFGKIVSSLVDDILMPLIGILIGGKGFDELAVTVGTAKVQYGIFIQNIIDFLIIALAIFVIIKQINAIQNKFKEDEKEEAPTEKTCPYCKSKIPVDATRCPHCTSELK